METLNQEVLRLVRGAAKPITCVELYEMSNLAVTRRDVSLALAELHRAGRIKRVDQISGIAYAPGTPGDAPESEPANLASPGEYQGSATPPATKSTVQHDASRPLTKRLIAVMQELEKPEGLLSGEIARHPALEGVEIGSIYATLSQMRKKGDLIAVADPGGNKNRKAWYLAAKHSALAKIPTDEEAESAVTETTREEPAPSKKLWDLPAPASADVADDAPDSKPDSEGVRYLRGEALFSYTSDKRLMIEVGEDVMVLDAGLTKKLLDYLGPWMREQPGG